MSQSTSSNTGGRPGPTLRNGRIYGTSTLIRERRPRTVVEIGSGCSTIVFAQALSENLAEHGTQGHLYAFDGSEHWLEQTRRYFPDELRGSVDFILGQEEEREMFGEQVRLCTNIGAAPAPNFLYIDGLNVIPDVPIGAEALNVEKTAPADMLILVDGRGPTVKFLTKYLRRDYRVYRHPLQFWTTFTPKSQKNDV